MDNDDILNQLEEFTGESDALAQVIKDLEAVQVGQKKFALLLTQFIKSTEKRIGKIGTTLDILLARSNVTVDASTTEVKTVVKDGGSGQVNLGQEGGEATQT